MKAALYRKYRPRRFDDVVGQDAAVAALKNQVRNGRIGHSYIFTGIRGTGKTSLAKILARAVNCPDQKGGEPCGVCGICAGIDNGSMLDVTEIDAASNSGVDNVRALREETAYYPAVCAMRVYIIDEVHMLTREAFNALLKIMEEPPSHVLFILATTEVHKVPATILSRCQRFDLRRISAGDIEARLRDIAQKEDIDLTGGAASLIARLADGALRDALSLLDTCSSLGGTVDEETVARLAGVTDKSYLFELSGDIARGDIQSLFGQLAELHGGSVDPARLCLELVRHYRNLLMTQVSGVAALPDCSAEDIARYQAQAREIEGRDVMRALDELGATADKMTSASDRMLALELCFIKLCTRGAQRAEISTPREEAAPLQAPGRVNRELPPQKTESAPSAKDDDVPWEASMGEETPLQNPGRVNRDQLPPKIGSASQPDPPQTAKDGEPQAFDRWSEVVDTLLPVNGMLYGFLQKSRAYLTDTHVLIEADDIFLQHMRKNNDAKEQIKDAIQKTTGVKLPIGPYTLQKKEDSGASKQDEAIEDLLARAQESGVEIEIVE